MNDSDLAARMAESAGSLLMELRRSRLLDGRLLGATGDAVAQQFLASVLMAHRPGDAVLSEEAKDSKERLDCRRVWIIDPLDGTREYSEGRDDWAVHVALAIDGEAVLGAVSQPALGTTYRSDQIESAPPPEGRFRMVVSRSRPPKVAENVAEALKAEVIPMGSAGAKAMAVLRGQAHAYVHAGGQYEWDSAAPVAVAVAAGLCATRLDGKRPAYNTASAYMPDILIFHPSVRERLECALEQSPTAFE